MTRPSVALRRKIVASAGNRCEHCLIHQKDVAARHQVDHIIAEKHGGETTLQNLALSCIVCNRRKSSDIAAIDPESGQLAPLFNPRTQEWFQHFQLSDLRIVGRTAVGSATVEFLQLNAPDRLLERASLIRLGRLTER